MKKIICKLYLYIVAYKKQYVFAGELMTTYYSKFDNSYITFEGLEEDIWFFS